MDIMPTLCDIAGLDAPPHMRGTSLRPLLEKGSSFDRDSLVTEMPGNRARLVRTRRYKYITYAGESRDLFFDRQQDPGEIHNLAHDRLVADRVAEHRLILREWERQLDVAPDVVTTDAWWYRV